LRGRLTRLIIASQDTNWCDGQTVACMRERETDRHVHACEKETDICMYERERKIWKHD
jgi:hypothetical protein